MQLFFLALFANILAATSQDVGGVNLVKMKQLLDAGLDAAGQVDGDVEKLKMYLRAGDFRLVRPGPSGETAHRQVEIANAGGVQVVTSALQSAELSTRIMAAELTHLLTTNNPANRVAFGVDGAIPPLVDMVKAGTNQGSTDETVLGGEEAAEAIWILAFAGSGNGGENHPLFAKAGAVKALAEFVKTSPSARGRMWAAAALGNLGASYSSVPIVDSEAARKTMLQYPGLLDALVAMMSEGPVQRDTPSDQWPSQATIAQRFSRSIEPWGAGQALKSIALSHSAHTAMKKAGVVKAACRLQSSPDWLEKMKSDLTLQNLGAHCGHEQDLL